MKLFNTLVAAAAFLFTFAVVAFATTSSVHAGPVAPSSFISVMLSHAYGIAATGLAMAGAWTVGLLVRLLGASNAAKHLEVEGKLREALHFAAENGLRFAIARAGFPGIAAPTADMIADAMFYVTDKNPGTLKKLGVTGDALEHIILSKWPIFGDRPPFAPAAKATPAA
ncbi:hypothetical protein I6F11_17500 [Ensifer sp. NBAIM29]|nr:hypothetical protein [Ensifer sp. NBAIM29]